MKMSHMKTTSYRAALFFSFAWLLSPLAAFGDPVKIASPRGTATVVVDQSGRRDLISIRSSAGSKRLFYEDIDSLKPAIAKAYNLSVSEIGKIVLPTFIRARWISDTQAEITCETGATYGNNGENIEFEFTALVNTNGNVSNIRITKKQ
jgi:hypothetical protein